jgi:hypothetical protein
MLKNFFGTFHPSYKLPHKVALAHHIYALRFTGKILSLFEPIKVRALKTDCDVLNECENLA